MKIFHNLLFPTCLLLGILANEAGAVWEAREISWTHGNGWQSVNLQSTFNNPIVVMGPHSFNGADPSTIRVRNVTGSSFEFQVDEWKYLDGTHEVVETIGCLVVEAGSHTIGGLAVEAGSLSVDENWATGSLSAFGSPPVIVSQTVTVNGPDPVATRLRNVSATSFEVRLQEEEGAGGTHAFEQVHYVAIEPGTSTENFKAGTTGTVVTEAWHTIDFGATFTAPVFLGAMQTFAGQEPAALRHRNLGASSVQVKVEEEQSADSEVGHNAETVGWFAFAAPAALVSPANNATVSSSPTLTVTTDSAAQGNLTVTFYGREAAREDFVIPVFPDTQNYARENSSSGDATKEMWFAQTDWILANRVSQNIPYVATLGDCVHNADKRWQWRNATNAMYRLEDPATTLLADGIPYGVTVGNHDQYPFGDPNGDTSLYNEYFGTDHFQDKAYYGGNYGSGSNNDNWYDLFSAGGMDFLVFSFEYGRYGSAILDWAESIAASYPNRRIIVLTHFAGQDVPQSQNHNTVECTFSNQGSAIYNRLKTNPNFFLMLGGHVAANGGEGRRSDTYNGNTVHTLISDYQRRFNGGDGLMRLMYFSPKNNTVTVKTYSPWSGAFETDNSSEFTFTYDMQPDWGSLESPYVALQTNLNVAPGSQTSFVWPGLQPGKNYEWYVSVTDQAGNSAASSEWRFSAGNIALNRPVTSSSDRDATLTADNAVDGDFTTRWASEWSDPQWIQVDLGDIHDIDRVILYWEPAHGTSYEIQASDDASSWTTLFSTTTGDGGVDDLRGLGGSGRYVRMYGTVRYSPYSYSLWEFEVYGSPADLAPSDLMATAVSSSQIDLAWNDNSSDEDDFEIQRKTGGGSYSTLAVVGAGSTSYSDTGLISSTPYTYRVRARSASGDSAWSNEAGATTLPAAPTGLTATAVSSSQIDLAWNDNSSDEDDFEIQRKTGGGSYSTLAVVGAGSTSYNDTGLTSSTTYTYRVRARNANGDSAWSNEAGATTPPAAPSGLSAIVVSSSRIDLEWTDNSGDETGFEIQRKTASGSYSTIHTTAANATSYSNTGLSPGTAYTYRVRALNANGSSAWSNEAGAATPLSVLPGQTIALKANANGLYVSAWKSQPNAPLHAMADQVLTWELFDVVDAGGGKIALVAHANDLYVSARQNEANTPVRAQADQIGSWAKFEWIDNGDGTIALKANDGNYVSARINQQDAPLEARNGQIGSWAKFVWELVLPSPWQSQDIGAVGATGGAIYANGTFTVEGSGADIWGTADEFRYVYQPASGDCEMEARVTSLENTHAAAKGVVMIRESLNANSAHAMTIMSSGNGVKLTWRNSTGGTTSNTGSNQNSAPYWIRLKRTGNTFTAYQSSNGTSWSQIGSTTVTMGSSVYIGLGVTSHDDGTLCTATFDNVTTTP